VCVSGDITKSSTQSANIPRFRTRIGANEVTVASFKECVDAGVCGSETFVHDAGSPCNWNVSGRENHPMNCVDWNGGSFAL
jgi:formylglycine-generating enzyme required for sulfatase activity